VEHHLPLLVALLPSPLRRPRHPAPASHWAPVEKVPSTGLGAFRAPPLELVLSSTLNGPCMVYATDTDQGRGGPTVGYRRAVVPKRGRGTPERRAGKCSSPMANSFSCFVPSLHACHWRRPVGNYGLYLWLVRIANCKIWHTFCPLQLTPSKCFYAIY